MSVPPSPSRVSTPPATPEEALAEAQARLPTDLVLALYRLVRGCGLHADSNAAVISLVNSAGQILGEFCERLGVPHASVLMSDDAVFVSGRQLRARREAYAAAVDLGALMEKCGFNEVTLRAATSRQDLAAFARAFSDAVHGQPRAARLHGATFGGIRLRKVRGNPFGAGSKDQSPAARTMRSYAAAVVVLRDFLAEYLEHPENLPNRLKRVSQRLVSQFEEDPRMLIALAATSAAGADEATLSVNTAVLAVAVARQITADRVLLANLAMAALTYSVGRFRMSLFEDSAVGSASPLQRQLNEDEAAHLPGVTTACLVRLGKIHAPNMVRTAVTHEALWLRHAQSRGPVYQGRRAPTVLARILHVARSFAELLVPDPAAGTAPVDDVLQLLFSRAADATERTYLKLLVGALGIFPTGTVVELNTGEVAVVLGTPARAGEFAQPPVRIINDRKGEMLPEPLDVDLAQPPPPGEPRRFIRHPIEADESQMKAMRSYVLSLAPPRVASRGSQPSPTQPRQPAAPGPPRAAPEQPAGAPCAAEAAAPRRPSLPYLAHPDAPPVRPSGVPRPTDRPGSQHPAAPGPPAPPDRPAVQGEPTRAVSWEEYQERLAALREAAAPPAPQDAPREEALRPPGPAVPEAEPTRAVSWEEYEERLRGRPAPSPQDRAGKDGVKGLDAVLQEYLRGEDPPTGPSPPPPGSPRKR